MERLYNDIENFGKIFGIEDRAQAMINDLKARAAKIAERVDTLPEEEKMTVLTVQMVYENEFFGRTSTDFTHDLIEKAGGICLDEAFGKQSIENLIKLNPCLLYTSLSGVVYNGRSGRDDPSVALRFARLVGTELAGEIPMSPLIGRAELERRTVLEAYPDSPDVYTRQL